MGIDHIIDKRRVKGPVAKVDLSKQDGQATVLQWIESDKVDRRDVGSTVWNGVKGS